MLKTELKEGTSVYTSGGEEVGKINRFVLNPETNEVTHLVVQKGWLFSEDKVVPFDMVDSITEDRVTLHEDADRFEGLPPFEEPHYVRAWDGDIDPEARADAPYYRGAPAYYWYPPTGYAGFPAFGLHYSYWPWAAKQQNIPADTVPLKEGTRVMSSDEEHVGDVERLFLEPESNTATHFVISQGLLFKDRKLVPAHWIRSASEDGVHLSVNAQVLERLPSYED